MTKRDIKYLIISFLVILLFVIHLFYKKIGMKAYREVQKDTLTHSLKEGNYRGSFQAYHMNLATVSFTIDDDSIHCFTIERIFTAPWISIKEALTDSIQKNNSLNFDAVSGATQSSYYVKAAIQDAIKKQQNP